MLKIFFTGRSTDSAASCFRQRCESTDTVRGRPGSQATIVHAFPSNCSVVRADEQLGTASIHLGTDVFSQFVLKQTMDVNRWKDI